MVGCKSEINALKLEASVGQLAGQSAAWPVPSCYHQPCSVHYQTPRAKDVNCMNLSLTGVIQAVKCFRIHVYSYTPLLYNTMLEGEMGIYKSLFVAQSFPSTLGLLFRPQ